VRTTVDLPDELMRAAKARAAERGESLKDLFQRALSQEIGQRPRKRGSLPIVPSTRAEKVSFTNEDIDDIVAEEFERRGA